MCIVYVRSYKQDDDEGIEAEFEGVIHGVMDSDKAGAEERAKEKLEPRSVDAYWLQRELNKFFKDPIVSWPPLHHYPLHSLVPRLSSTHEKILQVMTFEPA